jgi:hypothetical protein
MAQEVQDALADAQGHGPIAALNAAIRTANMVLNAIAFGFEIATGTQQTATDHAHSREPDHLVQVEKETNSFNGLTVTYRVVDKKGRTVTDVGVQEHVEVLVATEGTTVNPNPKIVSAPGGIFLDVVGPNGWPGSGYTYVKTLQTWTAYKDGEAFPLSTKINQYVVSNDSQVRAVSTVMIVP